MEEKYVFEVSGMDTGALLPQVSRALERRTELVSRERCPGLWRFTDRLNARSPEDAAKAPVRRIYRTIMGLALWLLGLFALVPGAMTPKVPALLITGGACCLLGMLLLWVLRRRLLGVLGLVLGALLCALAALSPDALGTLAWPGGITAAIALAALLSTLIKRPNRFDKSAGLLLEGRESIPDDAGLRVSLDEEGLSICAAGAEQRRIGFSELRLALETESLYLLFTEELVLPLQKRDLREGGTPPLPQFLASRVRYELV